MNDSFIWLVYAGFIVLIGGYAVYLTRLARRLQADES